jgi:hypothetical protein
MIRRTVSTTVVLLALWSALALAWGPSSHVDLARESIRSLYSRYQANLDLVVLLETYRPSFYAGANFPDLFMYSDLCLTHVCHLPETYQQAIRYAHDHFTPPYTTEQAQTIAYFLGIVCHTETDIPFHGVNFDLNAFLFHAIPADLPGTPQDQVGADMPERIRLMTAIDYWLQGYHLQGDQTLLEGAFIPTTHLKNILHNRGWTQITEEQLLFWQQVSTMTVYGEGQIFGIYFYPSSWWFPWTYAYFRDWPTGGYYPAADGAANMLVGEWGKLSSGIFPVRGVGPPYLHQPGLLSLPGAMDQPRREDGMQNLALPSTHEALGKGLARLLRSGVVSVPARRAPGGYVLEKPQVHDFGAFQRFFLEHLDEFRP